MPLIKHDIDTGRYEVIAEDDWTFISSDSGIDTDAENIIVPKDRLPEAFDLKSKNIGVFLNSSDLVEDMAEVMAAINIVVIDFPSFTDGRGFSTARRLRESLKFQGEIRAVGHVIRDQFSYLVRCGFNAVEIRRKSDVEGWDKVVSRFKIAYQPAFDNRPWVELLR